MKRIFGVVTFGLALAACARAESPRPPGGQVYVVQNGLGSGEVRVGLAKDGCGLDCAELHGRGAAARLVAKPSPGSLFDGFSGPCTGRMPCVVPLDKPHWVVASFRDASARWVSHVATPRLVGVSLAIDADGGSAISSAGEAWFARYDRDGKKSWELLDAMAFNTRAEAAAVDAAGDIVVVGKNGDGTFVEKRSSAGAPIWKKVFHEAIDIKDVVLDGNGEVLVCGTFSSPMKMGNTKLAPTGGLDVLVLRISADGKLLDAARLGGKGDDRAPHIATDGAGSIFIAYTTAATRHGEVENGAAHLVRYDSFGRVGWEREIGGLGRIDGISTSKRGEVVLAGRFVGAVDVLGKRLQSNGGSDVLVASVDAAGVASWARSFGGKYDDEAAAVAVDEGGRVAWLGTFQDQMLVGQKNLVSKQLPLVSEDGSVSFGQGVDVAFGVLSPEGEVQNARAFGGSGTDFARGIAWAPGGDVVILVEQEAFFTVRNRRDDYSVIEQEASVTSRNGGIDIASRLERMLMRRPADAP